MSRSNSEQPLEHKILPFEVKEVDLGESVFSGYSAAMGNEDMGRDVIEPGAFRKTIAERVNSRYIKLLDNHNSRSTQDVWGTVVEAEEVPFKGAGPNAPTHKLLTTFEVSKSDPNAQVALRKVAERHLDQLSIGFRPLKIDFEVDEGKEDQADDPYWAWVMGDGVRRIKEIQWWETSLVIWAMNPEAQVLMGSVDSLMKFARKAAQSGVHVPEDAVRDTIRALSQLVKAQGDGDPGDEVRRAVDEVRELVRTAEGVIAPSDAAERLNELAADFAREHGDADASRFVSWVVDNLEDPVEATKDTTDGTTDVPPTDEATPAAAEETPVADEVEEEEVKEKDAEGGRLSDEVLSRLADVAEKLAEALGAGASGEDGADPDETAAPTEDHAEDTEEAAKDVDPEEDDRAEHFPDGDELALTLQRLRLTRARAAA